jgi:hypothetical protein
MTPRHLLAALQEPDEIDSQCRQAVAEIRRWFNVNRAAIERWEPAPCPPADSRLSANPKGSK